MKLLIIILCILCNLSYGQEAIPAVRGKQKNYVKGYNTSKYNGYKVKIGVGILRVRTFGRDCIQCTYIIGNTTQIRLYSYFDLFDKKVTKCISLRYFI